MLKEGGWGWVFNWLQSATSLLDAIKWLLTRLWSYPLLNCCQEINFLLLNQPTPPYEQLLCSIQGLTTSQGFVKRNEPKTRFQMAGEHKWPKIKPGPCYELVLTTKPPCNKQVSVSTKLIKNVQGLEERRQFGVKIFRSCFFAMKTDL